MKAKKPIAWPLWWCDTCKRSTQRVDGAPACHWCNTPYGENQHPPTPQPQPFARPKPRETLDNESLQTLLALTLSKLAELAQGVAPEFEEQFLDIRDNIAWRD